MLRRCGAACLLFTSILHTQHQHGLGGGIVRHQRTATPHVQGKEKGAATNGFGVAHSRHPHLQHVPLKDSSTQAEKTNRTRARTREARKDAWQCYRAYHRTLRRAVVEAGRHAPTLTKPFVATSVTSRHGEERVVDVHLPVDILPEDPAVCGVADANLLSQLGVMEVEKPCEVARASMEELRQGPSPTLMSLGRSPKVQLSVTHVCSKGLEAGVSPMRLLDHVWRTLMEAAMHQDEGKLGESHGGESAKGRTAPDVGWRSGYPQSGSLWDEANIPNRKEIMQALLTNAAVEKLLERQRQRLERLQENIHKCLRGDGVGVTRKAKHAQTLPRQSVPLASGGYRPLIPTKRAGGRGCEDFDVDRTLSTACYAELYREHCEARQLLHVCAPFWSAEGAFSSGSSYTLGTLKGALALCVPLGALDLAKGWFDVFMGWVEEEMAKADSSSDSAPRVEVGEASAMSHLPMDEEALVRLVRECCQLMLEVAAAASRAEGGACVARLGGPPFEYAYALLMRFIAFRRRSRDHAVEGSANGRIPSIQDALLEHYREVVWLVGPLADTVGYNAQHFNMVFALWGRLLTGSDAAYEAETAKESRRAYVSLLAAFARVCPQLDPQTQLQTLQQLCTITMLNSRGDIHDHVTVHEQLVAALSACRSPGHTQTIFNKLSAPQSRHFLDSTDLAMSNMIQASSCAADSVICFFSFAAQRYRLSMNVVHALAAKVLIHSNGSNPMEDGANVLYTVLDVGVNLQRGGFDPRPERTFFLRMLCFYLNLRVSEEGEKERPVLGTDEQIQAAARIIEQWLIEVTAGVDGECVQRAVSLTISPLTIRLLQSVWIFLFRHFERKTTEGDKMNPNNQSDYVRRNPLLVTLRTALEEMSRGLFQGSERLTHSPATASTPQIHTSSRATRELSCYSFLEPVISKFSHTSGGCGVGGEDPGAGLPAIEATPVKLLQFPDYFNAYDCLCAWSTGEIRGFLESVQQLLTVSEPIGGDGGCQRWWLRLWDYCTLADLEAHVCRLTGGGEEMEYDSVCNKDTRRRFFCPSGLRAAVSRGVPLKVEVLDGLTDIEVSLWLLRRRIDDKKCGEARQEEPSPSSEANAERMGQSHITIIDVYEEMKMNGIEMSQSFSHHHDTLATKWLRRLCKESKLSEALIAPSPISDVQLFTQMVERLLFEKELNREGRAESSDEKPEARAVDELRLSEKARGTQNLSSMFVKLEPTC